MSGTPRSVQFSRSLRNLVMHQEGAGCGANGRFYCDATWTLPGHGEQAAPPLQRSKGRAATLSAQLPRTSKSKKNNSNGKSKSLALTRSVVLVPCRH